MCKNALHHVTVVDWLLSQMCIISFHRDCKALQDLLDPGDCQEKLYVLCHFSSCSWGVWTVRQWSSATQVTLAAPFVGGTAAIRCWSTVGWDLSTGHHLEFQETIYILLLKLFDRLEWIWILGSLKWELFTLVPLSILLLGFPFQLGDHCLAGMVKQQVVLVCVVQLLAVTKHRCYRARLLRDAVCLWVQNCCFGVSSIGTSQQSWNVPVFIAFLGAPHSGLPADWAGWWESPSWGF